MRASDIWRNLALWSGFAALRPEGVDVYADGRGIAGALRAETSSGLPYINVLAHHDRLAASHGIPDAAL